MFSSGEVGRESWRWGWGRGEEEEKEAFVGRVLVWRICTEMCDVVFFFLSFFSVPRPINVSLWAAIRQCGVN